MTLQHFTLQGVSYSQRPPWPSINIHFGWTHHKWIPPIKGMNPPEMHLGCTETWALSDLWDHSLHILRWSGLHTATFFKQCAGERFAFGAFCQKWFVFKSFLLFSYIFYIFCYFHFSGKFGCAWAIKLPGQMQQKYRSWDLNLPLLKNLPQLSESVWKTNSSHEMCVPHHSEGPLAHLSPLHEWTQPVILLCSAFNFLECCVRGARCCLPPVKINNIFPCVYLHMQLGSEIPITSVHLMRHLRHPAKLATVFIHWCNPDLSKAKIEFARTFGTPSMTHTLCQHQVCALNEYSHVKYEQVMSLVYLYSNPFLISRFSLFSPSSAIPQSNIYITLLGAFFSP